MGKGFRSLQHSRGPLSYIVHLSGYHWKYFSSYMEREQLGFKESSSRRRRKKFYKEINIAVPQNLVLFSFLLKRLL